MRYAGPPNLRASARLNSSATAKRQLTLEPHDTRRLSELSGQFHEHIKLIEQRLGVVIHGRGNHFRIEGAAGPVNTAVNVLETLYAETGARDHLNAEAVHMLLATLEDAPPLHVVADSDAGLLTRRGAVKPRGSGKSGSARRGDAVIVWIIRIVGPWRWALVCMDYPG